MSSVLITGGNSGIGKATALALAQKGWNVILTARDRQRGEAAARDIGDATGRQVEVVDLDLSSLQSVKQCAEAVQRMQPALDVLVNNAGLVLGERRVSVDGMEMTFAVNHVGHFFLTHLLLDSLRQAAAERGEARIVNVSSDAHRRVSSLSFDDLMAERHYDGFEVYSRSKLANVLFSSELARRLAGTSITSNALHPGVVATRFAQDGDSKGLIALFFHLFAPLLRSSKKGAESSIFLSADPSVRGTSGGYFFNSTKKRPS
ncbi:MAG: SDR family oxidoreductase, partial [Myxococcota bacterium]